MKKAVGFISMLLVVTVLMLIVFEKYYPSSIVEVYLKDYYAPEKISKTFNIKYPYEHINIYEIFSAEGNANVYTGNLNIILRNCKIEDYGIDNNKNTFIAGDKYIEKKDFIDLSKNPIKTKFGEYYLKATIKNGDEAYFCDTDILKNSQIRRQKLYMILNDSDKLEKYMNYETILRLIKSEGIEVAASVSYKDISDFFKKLILIFCFALNLIGFIYMLKSSIARIKCVIKKYKELKYDMYLRSYLSDKQSLKLILTGTCQVIGACCFFIALIILFAMIINLRLSFSLNPTSYTSIKDTLILFVGLMRYFLRYGFSEISFVLIGILFTYLIALFIAYMAVIKKICHDKSQKPN